MSFVLAGGRSRGRLGMLVCAAFVGVAVALLWAGTGEARAAGTVTVGVTGQGSASGDGIDCNQSGGPDCSQTYDDVQECEFDPETRQNICFDVPPDVTLTAGADTNGYVYDGWDGCDSTSARECYLTVTGDRSVTARFRDAQAPSVGSVSPAGGVRRGSITLSAAASDNSGAVNRVEFRVRGGLVGTDTSAPYSLNFNTATVADGSAVIRATAFDAAGNSSFSESLITIDNTAPTVGITSGPDGQTFGPDTTQTWTFSAGDATSGVASVQCSVVAEGSAPSFGSCSGGSTSHSVSNRPEGDYTFTVRVTDNGGLQTTASRSFSIDATPPSLSVSGPTGELRGAATHAWDITAADGGSGIASVECSVQLLGTGASFGPCSEGQSGHEVSNLPEGDYQLVVRATDGAGLQRTVERAFSIDATPPDTAITSGPKKRTTRKRARFAFISDSPGSSFACKLDGAAYRPCSSPATFKVGKGKHKLLVRATDRAGNPDPTPAVYTWKVRRKRR